MTSGPERGHNTEMASEAKNGTYGVLCALPEELGSLARLARGRREANGLELIELELSGQRVLATCGGVGKVRAARGATLLVAAGVDSGLLVVGVCGGLRAPFSIGEMVHCTRAVQADLAVRQDREVEPDSGLLAAWRAVQPGRTACFLTADRPALSWWRRSSGAGEHATGVRAPGGGGPHQSSPLGLAGCCPTWLLIRRARPRREAGQFSWASHRSDSTRGAVVVDNLDCRGGMCRW